MCRKIVKISRVQVRTEEYRMIEVEIATRLHSDLSANFFVEIRCQETASGDRIIVRVQR